MRQCVNVAVNRGHGRVLEGDILTAERSYSEDQLQEVSFELRDVSPLYSDVLYEFIAANHILLRREIHQRLTTAGVPPAQLESVLDLLIWFGFLGVNADAGETERYSYQFQYRTKRMLQGLAEPLVFVIHPAFRVGLGCPE